MIDELGIEVLGVYKTLDEALKDHTGISFRFGNAFAIGENLPYNLYIYTRKYDTAKGEYVGGFINFGEFPAKGDKGDKGDNGATGPQGPIGEKGDTGKEGLQGIQGPKGDKGDKGEVGDTGAKGERGPYGPSFNVIATLESASQLPVPTEAMQDNGTAYIIPENDEKHVWIIQGENGVYTWIDLGPSGVQGEKGDKGDNGFGFSNTTIISQNSVDSNEIKDADITSVGTFKVYEATTGQLVNQQINYKTPIKAGDGITFTSDGKKTTIKSNNSNLVNGSGSSSLNQVQDGTTGTFDFTNKNPNATAIDSSLTGQIAYGGQGAFATSFGGKSSAQGKRSFACGTTTIAKGDYSFASGDNSVALGTDSHAEGTMTTATGYGSHAEGYSTTASATASHAEGYQTKATVDAAHAEGYATTASGNSSHAEGYQTTANNDGSHTEGYATTASGNSSHAEGSSTTAIGSSSHAEGYKTTAKGANSHTEGYYTVASHQASHAEGYYTKTGVSDQHVSGKYNVGKSNTFFEVGNGTSDTNRKNAFEVLFDGRAKVQTAPTEDDDVVRLKELTDKYNTLLARIEALENK